MVSNSTVVVADVTPSKCHELALKVEAIDRQAIVAPTVHDIRTFAPQISLEEAAQFLEQLPTERRLNFAGPSFLVRGVYHEYYLHIGEHGPARLYRATARHTQGIRKVSQDIGQQAAVHYAEENWAAELIPNNTHALEHALVVNPRDQATRELAVALSKDWPALESWPEPFSEAIDDAIIDLTPNRAAQDELDNGCPSRWGYYCALCGGGLSAERCTVCLIPLTPTRPWKSTEHPMPLKLVRWLESRGHVFETDPIVARVREHRLWCSQMACKQPSTVSEYYGKAQRSIHLEDE